jgi:hypothetical protein
MRAGRDGHAGQCGLAVADRAIGDRAGNEVLAGKIVGIERAGGLGLRVEPVDRHALLLVEFLIEMAPVGRQI